MADVQPDDPGVETRVSPVVVWVAIVLGAVIALCLWEVGAAVVRLMR